MDFFVWVSVNAEIFDKYTGIGSVAHRNLLQRKIIKQLCSTYRHCHLYYELRKFGGRKGNRNWLAIFVQMIYFMMINDELPELTVLLQLGWQRYRSCIDKAQPILFIDFISNV